MPIFQYPKRLLPLAAILVFSTLLIIACNHSPPNHYESEFYRELQSAREKTETAQKEVLHSKQQTAYISGIAVAGSVIALVVGAALGSKARRDANARKGGETYTKENETIH